MPGKEGSQFRCVLHGSFRKHFDEIKRVHRIFAAAGIEVLAPSFSEIKSFDDNFAILEGDRETDPRMIELLYLHHLKRLGENGFSYFVDPEGYIGRSTSYELGIAQVTNVRCFFMQQPADHPAYVPPGSVWRPESIVDYVGEHGTLPEPSIKPDEARIKKLWEDLLVPGSVVAVGGIIEYAGVHAGNEKEVLLVKTHKWGGRYSVVGGKVRRHERLDQALLREVKEETGLSARVGQHLCTFDQLKNSGYYVSSVQHIFVDKVIQVDNKQVRLNDEAQEYLWVPPKVALRDLAIEPNARHTLELYARKIGA
jgi:ADP-ribose pyrophosphatase YjhB (NUDIX family)